MSADEVLVHNICGKPDSTTQIDMDEVMRGHTVDGNRAKQSGKQVSEMWYNVVTNIIETVYSVDGKKGKIK